VLFEIVATTAAYLLGCCVFQLFARDWAEFTVVATNVVVFAALLYWVIA
jgi:hypothetical protein